MERTFAIVKPDAVKQNFTGKILSRIEEEGFRLVALRMTQMSRRQAEGFYAVHRERPFFGDLCEFMSSGRSVVMVLEAPGAIRKWRDVMGATDPGKADEGTIRKLFGTNIEQNATHGSDAPDTAQTEIAYFFGGLDLI